MSTINQRIQEAVSSCLSALYEAEVPVSSITINETRKEFEGDLTVVSFPFLRYTKKSPEDSGRDIGEYLVEHVEEIVSFNVVKGFINCSLSKEYWTSVFKTMAADPGFGRYKESRERVLVEYSSPNTNKPLHLGHIRNNVLGYAVCCILEANGHDVIKANLVNDRGIHICKSMVAWKHYGNGETPETAGLKGDHLVGKYYVRYNTEFNREVAELIENGVDKDTAKKQAPILLQAQEMLRKWEAEDAEVRQLWETMNGWVYAGFDKTYADLGVSFDKFYYESNTYLLGRDVVLQGLEDGIFYRKDDGSVWVDLTDDGLDEKILLRADGTSVYMTQDIGTADLKYDDYEMKRSIYVVGNEQDYHFKVLQLVCQKIGRPYADGMYHLSYGMVELPEGKMKSREGTVVDADDLIATMIATARERTEELGKIEGFSAEQLEELYRTLALGALKFFLLKVDAKKNMMFNPEESIDLQGYTGPFVQYTYARIRSVLRKGGEPDMARIPDVDWEPLEGEIIKALARFEQVVHTAAEDLNPSGMVDYAYHLARLFNKYYAEVTILGAADDDVIRFRLMLSSLVARTIRSCFAIVGIDVPERM